MERWVHALSFPPWLLPPSLPPCFFSVIISIHPLPFASPLSSSRGPTPPPSSVWTSYGMRMCLLRGGATVTGLFILLPVLLCLSSVSKLNPKPSRGRWIWVSESRVLEQCVRLSASGDWTYYSRRTRGQSRETDSLDRFFASVENLPNLSP